VKSGSTLKRMVCLLVCAALMLPLVSEAVEAHAAAAPLLTLSQAQKLAVTNSADIKKKFEEIVMKKTKYVEAVKKIKAKIKNITSFRWTPLLNFKLPESLDLVEEYDLHIKPLVLQAEIKTLEHAMNDLRYQAICDVSKAYLNAYVLQEKITFNEMRLAEAQKSLARNRARLVTGDAKQDDVDKMQQSVDSLTSGLSNLKRNFENAKKQVADLTGIRLSSDTRFANPLKVADIPRKDLEKIIKHTLENDQTYYEAKMAVSTAKLNLDAYLSFMQSQYGSKMSGIMPFVNMVKQGVDIDFSAFKKKYDEMLKLVDDPWVGRIWILFLPIPKEWFKGQISGTRYVEDEMYALYAACQEYIAARKDAEKAEEALTKEVSKSYESIVTARNSYLSLVKQLKDSRELLEKVAALNRLGKADYSELKDMQDTYEEMQLETVDALAFYSELLYDFDRLTCGAVTKYLKGETLATEAAEGGDSYAEVDPIDKPYYYIYTDVDDLVFVFGVNIPDDFEPKITDFEIWYEGTMLGQRTSVDKQIRHLTIDYGSGSMLKVRLFNEGKFVDECEVDTAVPRDVLDIRGSTLPPAPEEKTIGSYTIETRARNMVNTSVLTLKPEPGFGVKFYSLTHGTGNNIYTSELIPIEESFTYLTLLIASLDDVTLALYDNNREKIHTARFDTSAQKIIAKPE
jgi:hypothetical protein